jgi:integrase
MIKHYKYKGKICYLIQLSYTDSSGKRHQPKIRKTPDGLRITSERAARMLEAEMLNDYRNEQNGNLGHILFSDWHKRFLSQIKTSYRQSTIAQYDGDLKKWLTDDFSKLPMKSIKKAQVHDLIFVSLDERGATEHTKKRILKSLKRIFQMAMDDGIIQRNPASGLSVKVPPSEKKVLNSNESNKLLLRAKELDHYFYFHWAMALFTGMRNGELYALRWENIDLESETIKISHSWTNKDGYHSTKSNSSRVIPISSELKRLLLELKNHGPFAERLTSLSGSSHQFDDLVLPRFSNWKHGEQARITEQFCKSIEITPVGFHDLRATFITNLLANGVSLPKVMALVGHTQTSTTDEYLRLAGVHVKGSTDQLGYQLPTSAPSNIVALFS